MAAPAGTSELAALDACAQAALVRDGVVTPLDLVDAALERIDAIDPQLGAVIHRFDDEARATARGDLPDGPFRGVPFLLKDGVAHSAGHPFHAGMRYLRDLGWTEDSDTELVARVRAAGFVIVGKTNLPELASLMTTEPVAYGPTRNPWDLGRSTSGSSGGSAAAVAAGLVPVAHGNDMGGSIRGPASLCGIVGLKPSRARTTLAPDFGEYWGPTTHEGVLTRTVRDTAAVLDAVAGPAPGDPYTALPLPRPLAEEVGADPGSLRIGIRAFLTQTSDELPDPACLDAVESTAELLEALGHRVDSFGPAALDEPIPELGTLFCTFIARDVERWAERTGAGRDDVAATLEPLNASMASVGRAIPATTYIEALDRVSRWARRVLAWWTDWDVLLTPTTSDPAFPLGEDPFGLVTRTAAFTLAFNLTGQPAISLPLHWTASGLPVGVQLVAAPGREDVLVRLASQLEAARPWADRWPPVNALGLRPAEVTP